MGATATMAAEHELRWITVAESDDIVVGTDSVPTAETGAEYRALAFYEGTSQVAITQPTECDGGWHYFFATIDDSMQLKLYLDGTELALLSSDSREINNPGTAKAAISSFPADFSIPAGSNPSFRVGAGDLTFDGWLNDVRVYSRALTSEEVQDQMFATCTNDDANRDSGECLDLGNAEKSKAAKTGLELWLNFNDENNANPNGTETDPVNPDVVHGCTAPDALPADASFSRYLSCAVHRDTRDEADFGGAWEYCNDYSSLIGK
eukprot:scaffold680951_cov47-Prasinocladus_malaysianus.AAC.1